MNNLWNMPYMAGNPSANPYIDRLAALQAQQTRPYQITRVNGRNGAEAFQLPPNSSCLLLDESQPIVWLKTSDGAGYPTLTPYTITPYEAEPAPDYKSFEERLTRLEEKLNGKSNVKKTEPVE